MNPIPYLRRSAIAAAAMAVFGVPGSGHAQTVTVSSMAQAVCVGTCSTVRFTIGLNGTFYSHRLRLWSSDPSAWAFGGVVDVKDGSGNSLAFTSSTANGGLYLQALYPWSITPIYVTTSMLTASQIGKLYNGSINYELLVSQSPTGAIPRYEPTGTLTPEPGSLLLLGTGLVGVIGAARRRKREGISTT